MEPLANDVNMQGVFGRDDPKLEEGSIICEADSLLASDEYLNFGDVHCIWDQLDHVIQQTRLSHFTEEVVVAE